MNIRKKLTCMLAAALVVLSLSACAENSPGTNTGTEPIQGETNAPVNETDDQEIEPAPGTDNGQENEAQEDESQEDEDLPATRELELELEGDKELKTASVAQGTGYAVYVFDIFTFNAEADRLTMNVDHDFYADIHKLPSDYSVDQLRKEAEDELSGLGEVREENDPLMQDAEFFLTATNNDLTRKIMVKEIDGTGFMFHLNVPHREPIEGFNSHTLAMLNSIVPITIVAK